MPTQFDLENYRRYMETGMCACGNHESLHAATTNDLKNTPFKCCLTRDEVSKWHTPRTIAQ